MKVITVELNIKAPMSSVLDAFSDYKHAPVLHKKFVKSVEVLEQDGNVSVALWRLKVLWFWTTAKQRQTVLPPNRLTNETIGGFATGTVEDTRLREDINGTQVSDTVEIRIPRWGILIEKIVAAHTKRLVTAILLDHKRNLETNL